MKLLPFLVLPFLALTGCGGSKTAQPSNGTAQPSSRATAEFTIEWPAANSRLIPIASKAIRLEVKQNGTKVGEAVAVKASGGAPTTVQVKGLPAGGLTVEASAYPEVTFTGDTTGVSGNVQAKGTAPLKTEPGKIAKTTLTMAATVARYAISPNPAKVKSGIGNGLQLVATAYDEGNRVVLVEPELQQKWSTADYDVANVSVRLGVVEGRKKGHVLISMEDTENNKRASIDVEVVDELPVDHVTVQPSTASVASEASFQVTAQAFDKDNNDLGLTADKFTWTTSDAAIATVDANGRVTAAKVTQKKSVTITATVKNEDGTEKKSSATLTVDPAASGGRIFFRGSANRNEGILLYSVAPDGSDLRVHRSGVQFDGSFIGDTLRVSSDGKTMTFGYTEYTLPDINFYVQSVDGAGADRVSFYTGPNSIGGPADEPYNLAIRPDGGRVTYTKYLLSNGMNPELWITNPSGSSQQKLFTFTEGTLFPSRFHWSEDGRTLVASNYSTDRTLVQIDVSTGATKSFGPAYAQPLDWFPDSAHVLTDVFAKPGIAGLDGSYREIPIADIDTRYGCQVSPEGTQFAYMSEQGLSVANLDGTNVRVLFPRGSGTFLALYEVVQWSRPTP